MTDEAELAAIARLAAPRYGRKVRARTFERDGLYCAAIERPVGRKGHWHACLAAWNKDEAAAVAELRTLAEKMCAIWNEED